jgi:hypothetical protein
VEVGVAVVVEEDAGAVVGFEEISSCKQLQLTHSG